MPGPGGGTQEGEKSLQLGLSAQHQEHSSCVGSSSSNSSSSRLVAGKAGPDTKNQRAMWQKQQGRGERAGGGQTGPQGPSHQRAQPDSLVAGWAAGRGHQVQRASGGRAAAGVPGGRREQNACIYPTFWEFTL